MMSDGNVDESEMGDAPDFSSFVDDDGDEIIKDLTARVNSLSVQEREAGLHDIHGIGGIDDKSAVEEAVLVNKMRLILSERKHWRASEAFRMADAVSPAYTRDPRFLLMFLRCDNYNIDAATNRLFGFFREKLRLFGPEKLGKKLITLADLSADDMKSYSAGWFQLLPYRDHVGRAQFVTLPQFHTWDHRENALRIAFHLCMTAVMDEETQKKGAVIVVYSLTRDLTQARNPKSYDPIIVWQVTQLFQKAIPLRFVGIHTCTNPSSFGGRFFASMARFVGDIARMRFHQGKQQVQQSKVNDVVVEGSNALTLCTSEGSFNEINEQLSSFGIHSIWLAVSHTGEKKTEKHKELIKQIKAIEHASELLASEKLFVLVPSTTDVLLGRGKPIQNHPGNLRLGLIVESQLAEYYEIANRKDKTKLAEITVTKMKQAGVRFLSRENGYWELADERAARERVSNTFRTVRDRLMIDQETMNVPADSTVARKRPLENADVTD